MTHILHPWTNVASIKMTRSIWDCATICCRTWQVGHHSGRPRRVRLKRDGRRETSRRSFVL